MPTDKLGLPTINGSMTSDVVRDLNALAQAVDDKVGAPNGIARLGLDGKLLPSQENVVELPDASTTQKGIVQLDDSVDSTSTTKAATANAVNKVKKLFSNVANFAVATVTEAKAGLVNNKYMTPLRVSEAITSLAPKDTPNGYAGLDESGKILTSAVPSSVKAYERIAYVDFQLNPAANYNVLNLEGFKEILVKFLQTKTTSTSNTVVIISYNGINGTSAYVGSTTTGSINSQALNIATASAYPIVNGELEINNENPYYMTEMKSYTETIDGTSGSHSIGLVSLRNKRNDRLQNIQFSVGASNIFNGGAIEILGVRR